MATETTWTKPTIVGGTPGPASKVKASDHNDAWGQLEAVTNKVLRWMGHVPAPGRIEYTYNVDETVATHTIYDATSLGNVVESATYTYADGKLSSLARVRDGQTLTDAYAYNATTGLLEKVTRTVA